MRRRPNLCDACGRLRGRPAAAAGPHVPYCDAFPQAIPPEIQVGGFDHRLPYPGDGGVRFEPRPGGERALAAYEHRLRTAGDG